MFTNKQSSGKSRNKTGGRAVAQSSLQTATIRSFEGGLNIVDTDLNMSPKFAKILDNMERGLDGSLSVRAGTHLFTTITQGASGAIINMTYFNNVIIAVQADGTVTRTDGAGLTTLMGKIWAGPVTYVSFTIFNSQLMLHNGINKPLMIEGNANKPGYMTLLALVDLASSSNVNTPIGKFGVAHRQYHAVAGIAAAPSTLYLSARGTAGTFPGDAAPNDSIALDLGPRVSAGSSAITGLVAYRDKLIVGFEWGVLPLTLGVYAGSPSVHTPTDDGFIEEYGCLAHRAMFSVGDDTFYADNIGVMSIERIVLNNTLRPKRASQLIDPLITDLLKNLTPAQISQYVFSVYDMRHSRYILFVPVFVGSTLTETIGFSYTTIPVLKVDAWARLRGWKWSCATRTALQNVMFARDNKIYYYAFDDLVNNADYVGDTSFAADGKGVPIDFDWEMPWADFSKRMDAKECKYIAMDTLGYGAFTVRGYVDNFYQYQGQDSPMLTMQFLGGSAGGFGSTPYGDAPFGGGRLSREERLFAWTTKFKLMKLRFSGSTKQPLRFISVSIAYVRKTIRR